MYSFSNIFKEHSNNPRNIGIMQNPDGEGKFSSDCGDFAACAIKVDKTTGIIKDVKFTLEGCGVIDASASIISETAMNKPIAEMKNLTNEDIAQKLGGIPEEKMHCVNLSSTAFKEAIKNYESKK